MSDFYNLVICTGADSSGFSCLMTDCIPDLGVVPSAQCFPLYTFEHKAAKEADMFDEATEAAWYRHDGIRMRQKMTIEQITFSDRILI